MTMRFGISLQKLIGVVAVVLASVNFSVAQSRTRSIPFTYLPDQSEDQYNQRIKQKTLPVDGTGFIILSKKTESIYAVEFYTNELKKSWEAALPLSAAEEVEAFTRNDNYALVIIHRKNQETGLQNLLGYTIDLKTGKKSENKKLAEAPIKSRRLGVAFSEDGTKLVTYNYLQQQAGLKAIQATIYDGNLNKVQERTYGFQDLVGIQSANVKIDNAGFQYVALINNNATKLSVRRYSQTGPEIKGMDIQVGGVFEGKKVYILDTFFALQQDSSMYAAATVADEKTGDFYSLKVIKFDFASGEMKYAPEFRFTPHYLADINKLNKSGTPPVKRLSDIYLSDIVVSPEKHVLVLAEKKYNEGPKLPFAAREIHLFTYDEFMNPTWHSILNKSQVAPASEGFTGISYKANVNSNELQLITLETLNNKTDLFSRKINIKDGTTAAPQPLKLNVSANKPLAYLKDFTAWLNDNTLVAVFKPSRKSKALQLTRITIK
ncbi:hypothetical protein [Adhaeribacter rhizoryzae]|uniref:Uncharacterized protein n=1 Tax=Adhaeribacter rhizoryzae TaxID=2607907 RepID=A0A5M6D919_9BACT|nr:hypothetical protein [Adhaeribacter rhizoryzae]KAA5544027.1 hypothetical protein F0145_15725 [Adhaeribacter rhizoryzae]